MAENTQKGTLSQEEYELLEKALFDKAIGGQETNETTVRTKLNENDEKVGSDIANITKTSEPDIGLIQELLANRIGGPQDYC